MTSEEKKTWAIGLLRQKTEELGRFPKKDDVDEVSRSRIKAYLGPWPRALEAAGLKESRPRPKASKKRGKNAPASRPGNTAASAEPDSAQKGAPL